MFRAKTVFILGAGASWHYGYPTGEELVKRVIKKAIAARDHFNRFINSPDVPLAQRPNIVSRKNPGVPSDGNIGLRKQWADAANECQELINRLTAADPLVIDYFIDQNQDLEEITKLCIAWVILECEYVSIRYGGNENQRELDLPNLVKAPPHNWIRFILHKLTTGCPNSDALFDNHVQFITFNYDVSFEIELYRGLGHLDRFKAVAERFIQADNRILHVYGRVRGDPPWQIVGVNWEVFGPISRENSPVRQPGPPQFWDDAYSLFNHAYDASKGLKIISPEKALISDGEVPDHIEKARKAIAEAECVYILGYGFDSLNNELLKLPEYLSRSNHPKTFMFTNYKNSGVISKNAARLFGIEENTLLRDGSRFIEYGNKSICEKSAKDVYGALALDFDSPEERPRAG